MYYVINTGQGLQITDKTQRDWSRVVHRAWNYQLAAQYVVKDKVKKKRLRNILYAAGFIFVMLAVTVDVS